MRSTTIHALALAALLMGCGVADSEDTGSAEAESTDGTDGTDGTTGDESGGTSDSSESSTGDETTSGGDVDPYPDCSMCGENLCVSPAVGDGDLCALACEDGMCPAGLTGTAEPQCVIDAPPPWPDGMCVLSCTQAGGQAECPDGMDCVDVLLPVDFDFVCVWL